VEIEIPEDLTPELDDLTWRYGSRRAAFAAAIVSLLIHEGDDAHQAALAERGIAPDPLFEELRASLQEAADAAREGESVAEHIVTIAIQTAALEPEDRAVLTRVLAELDRDDDEAAPDTDLAEPERTVFAAAESGLAGLRARHGRTIPPEALLDLSREHRLGRKVPAAFVGSLAAAVRRGGSVRELLLGAIPCIEVFGTRQEPAG
jgi:hypothetical protein